MVRVLLLTLDFSSSFDFDTTWSNLVIDADGMNRKGYTNVLRHSLKYSGGQRPWSFVLNNLIVVVLCKVRVTLDDINVKLL